MIRLAAATDLEEAEKIYEEVLEEEAKHGVTTNWVKGKYPTRNTAEKALAAGTFYVGEDAEGRIVGTVNLNHIQPAEYAAIPWSIAAEEEAVLVVHTLCIRPDCRGKGYARAFMAFAEELARKQGCHTIRLDTWEGNEPAKKMYPALGYRLAGETLFFFEQVIWETLYCYEKQM